jgi:ketosteroid isomerase-like protein
MRILVLTITKQFAQEHLDKWIRAWNARDLPAILAIYSDEVEFASPKVKLVLPEKSVGRVKGKKELERYWSLALQKYPPLHFAPVSFAINPGNDECFLEYVSSLNGQKTLVVEKFQFASNGLVVKSSAFYGAEG